MARRGRINYKPGRKERREMRRELSPEDFEIFRQNRLNERAAKRGITREELLAFRADKRANRQERRLAKRAERREMRRELSPEDFEIFRQNRLNERAAKRGITVDQLLEDREQRRRGWAGRKFEALLNAREAMLRARMGKF